MKTSSWEIIVAGFLFVGVAIYLIEQKADTSAVKEKMAMVDSLRLNMNGENIHVYQIKDLKQLENLKELEQLENLKGLKNLAAFLPAEFQNEFKAEVEGMIKEFEDQNVSIQIDSDKGTVSINKAIAVAKNGWTTVSPGVFAYVKEFDATDLKETGLTLPYGSIVVKGVSGSTAKLSLQASGLPTTADEMQSSIDLDSQIDSEKALFSVNSNTEDKNIHLQATLSIPQDSKVQFTTSAGHISSENIHGSQSYKTLGGHIKLNSVSGDLVVETGGGHIAISQSSGTMNLDSKGGNIRADKSEGIINMNTLGGNLFALDFSGTLNGSTNGGNIEVRFLEMKGENNLKTGAGSISLWVPETTNAYFNLSGNAIDISPSLNFNGSVLEGKATGTIGDKNASISAKTGYGNVILKALK